MDLRYVKKLVKLLTESQIDEIEIEEDGKKVRVTKNRDQVTSAHQVAATPPPACNGTVSGCYPIGAGTAATTPSRFCGSSISST